MKNLIKSLIFILILGISLLILVGCGKKEEKNVNNSVAQNTKNNNDNTNSNEQEENDLSIFSYVELLGKKQSYLVSFFDGGGRKSLNGASKADKANNIIIVSETGNEYSKDFEVNLSNATKKENILKAFEKTFCRLIQDEKDDHTDLTSTGYIDVTKQSTEKINGYDMCKNEGTYYYQTKDGNQKQMYFVVYSAILEDETPFYYGCVDSSENQNGKDKANELAKKGVKTLKVSK